VDDTAVFDSRRTAAASGGDLVTHIAAVTTIEVSGSAEATVTPGGVAVPIATTGALGHRDGILGTDIEHGPDVAAVTATSVDITVVAAGL
jgi:hypothetical protein